MFIPSIKRGSKLQCESKIVCWSLAVLLFSALAFSDLQAQVSTAVLSGTAMDTTGAVIVGVKIQAKDVGTGITYSTVTDGQGRYSIPELPVGTYDVSSRISGFQNVVQTGIVLTVGARPVLDFKLRVGRAEEEVQVHGQASSVDTSTATVGQLFSPNQMGNLPLNGRNFTDLLALAPGVATVPAGATSGGNSITAYGSETNYSVSGSRPVGTAYYMDGTDVRNAYNHGMGISTAGTSLGMDAIQEFTVLTNTYSAQFGGTGAAINMVTTSGANDLHGSGYEFIRNSALDGMNYFDVPGEKPPFKRNQFGGMLGGPIKKDKAFYFINYEGLRSGTGSTVRAVVPTSVAALNEDVGGMTLVNNQWVGPYGPANSVSEQILGLYPAPSDPSQCPNKTNLTFLQDTGLYCSHGTEIGNEDYGLARVDYTIGPKDSVFARYNIENGYQDLPYPAVGWAPGAMALPGYPEIDNERNQYVTIAERHTFSPTVFNEVRFGLVRLDMNAADGGLSYKNALTQGLAPMSFGPGQGITALDSTSTNPTVNVTNRFSVGDDVTIVRGAHSISIGLSFTRVQSNLLKNPNFNYLGGLWLFVGVPGGLFIPGTPIGSSLYGSPLLALDSAGPGYTYTDPSGVTYPWDPNRYWRQNLMAPYIQDDWKINKRLTLNVGVRYEWASNPTMVSGPLFVLNNILSPTTTEGSFVRASHEFNSNPNARTIDPRIGLAFDPFADHKTSIRAGFGIFHEPLTAANFGVMSMNPTDPSFEAVASMGLYPGMVTSFSQYSSEISWLYAMLPNVDTAPYVMQYNLTVQRQLWPGTVLNIGYNGSSGVHLMQWINANPPQPYGNLTAAQLNAPGAFGGPSIAQTFAGTGASGAGRPGTLSNPFTGVHVNPNFAAVEVDTPTAHSGYNSLQASLSRQFARSLVGNADYTWSKCLDDGSGASSFTQGGGPAVDALDPSLDRGPCSFSSNQLFSANAIYSLPFHGNRAVEGWQVSPVFERFTGLPLDVMSYFGPTDQSNIAGSTEEDRPDLVPGCNPMTKKIGQWFNPECFVMQPFGTIGSEGRDSLQGPNYFTADFAIVKNTKITERVNAQLRAEFFNVLNHPNFSVGSVSTEFSTATDLTPTDPRYALRTDPAAYEPPNPATGFGGGAICNPSGNPNAAVAGPCYMSTTAISGTMPGNLGGQREIQIALRLNF
jgi:hypothetical protein